MRNVSEKMFILVIFRNARNGQLLLKLCPDALVRQPNTVIFGGKCDSTISEQVYCKRTLSESKFAVIFTYDIFPPKYEC